MIEPVPVLLISGSMGAGKTAVLGEAHDQLAAAGVAHGSVDLDELAQIHPPQGDYGSPLMFECLAALWPIYRRRGAHGLIAARVVESRSELSAYREAIPGAEVAVCLLDAPVEVMQGRLKTREPGANRPFALARSAELASILQRAGAEDFKVANAGDRPVQDVAREVLTRAGWL